MKLILLVSALALVGCSKKSDEGAASADPCGAAIDKAVDKMIASRGADAPPQMTQIANNLRTLMTQHCRDDKWPADVIACFSNASDQPSIKNCRQQLPPDLAQKLQIDIIKAMSTGRDTRPGGMGHGGMGGGSGGGSGGGAAAGSDGGSAGSSAVPAGTKQ